MFPWPLRMLTRRTLSSGATRATTPISSISAISCSSDMAANSAPVIARPVMPSWPAIAAAVVAWSPVIIRTRMPASWHSAIASRASLRGGSTMPIERQQLEVLRRDRAGRRSGRTWPGRSPGGPRRGRACPRWPGGRSRPARGRCPSSIDPEPTPSASRYVVDAGQQHVRRPLDEAADHRAAVPSSISWNVAISLYSASNGTSPTRGYSRRVSSDVEPALLGQHDERALGRITDARTVADHRVVGQRHRQQERLERAGALTGRVEDPPIERVALAVDVEPPPDDRPVGGPSSG